MYVCWRVQQGRFEKNTFSDNGQDGISIGHRDTDNTFVGNEITGNKATGVRFRNERRDNAPDRNRFMSNTISGNGVGISVEGPTRDLEFVDNIVDDAVHDPHAVVTLQGAKNEED